MNDQVGAVAKVKQSFTSADSGTAATDPAVNVNDAAWALRIGWPEPARTLRYWIAFKVENDTEREYLLGKLDELMEVKS